MTTPNDVAAVVAAAPADTSVQVLNLWALAVLTFTNLGATLWNILSGPSKRNAAELKAHSDELITLGRRVSSLEDAGKEREAFRVAERLSCGDGERKTSITQQTAFEPLPPAYCSARCWSRTSSWL